MKIINGGLYFASVWNWIVYQTIQIKTHPGLKSKIWKYLGFLSDSDGIVKVTPDEAICELCNERIKHSNNTTNLLTHLKQHHSIQYDEIISEIRNEEAQENHSSPAVENTTSSAKTKQQSLPEIISKKETYKKNSPRYQTCQNALVSFMCNDLQPISVVDSPAFRQLLHTLDPRFEHSSAGWYEL